MKILCALVLFSLLGALPAFARIGETVSECEGRYGAVVERRPSKIKGSDADACIFSKAGITIVAEFKNGKAWRITYRMAGMTSDAKQTLLNAEAGEGGWSAPISLAGTEVRISQDHQRLAMLTMGKRPEDAAEFVFASKAYGDACYADYKVKLAAVPDEVRRRMADKPMKGL